MASIRIGGSIPWIKVHALDSNKGGLNYVGLIINYVRTANPHEEVDVLLVFYGFVSRKRNNR